MVTPYISQQPVDDFSLRFSNLKYSASVAATTDTTFVIPGDAPRYKALIRVEPDDVVWIAVGETAAVPAGAAFASTTSEMLTGNERICREVKAGETLHFYSTAGANVGISLYALGTNN